MRGTRWAPGKNLLDAKFLSTGNPWRPLRDSNSCLLRERDIQAFSGLNFKLSNAGRFLKFLVWFRQFKKKLTSFCFE